MPLFGLRKKNLEKSDSWNLGKSGLKSYKDTKDDLPFEQPANTTTAPTLGQPASDVRPQTDRGQTSRSNLASTEPTKSFVAELDGSTISSLPPSHRGGESITGSEPTKSASTEATSQTGSPLADRPDRLTQELLAPDSGEKEAVVSRDPMPVLSKSASDADKELYVSGRPEGSIFSMAVSSPSQMSRLYREYNFYNTPTFKDLVICDPTQRAIFYAEIFSHTRSKSDVELREFGNDQNIPGTKSMSLEKQEIANTRIVAVADFIPDENAAQVKLAVGDPLDPASNMWVFMKNVLRDKVTGAEKFDMPVPGVAGGSGPTFQWIKAGSGDHSEDGDESSDAKEAYRLVCESGVVASFRNTSVTNMRKRGSLRVYEVPMVDQYLLLIFLSATAMSEIFGLRANRERNIVKF